MKFSKENGFVAFELSSCRFAFTKFSEMSIRTYGFLSACNSEVKTIERDNKEYSKCECSGHVYM